MNADPKTTENARLSHRPARYRVTRGGWLFTLAILLMWLGAIVFPNNLLILIAAVLMAALLVSGLISRLCLAGLEVDYRVPEHVCAGRLVPGRLTVRNRKWLMPSISIRVEGIRDVASPTLRAGLYIPLLPSAAAVEETVEARFPRRGVYRRNGFAISTSFPFGFLEKTARVTLLRETLVYPTVDPRPGFEDLLLGIAGEIETYYRGLGRDFYRIRPYEIFESARHVDWKASAHVGSLQVREFAREQEQVVELFLDRNVPAELDAWFNHAVDCCAFLAWRLSGQGASIHFRSNAYRLRQPEEGDIYGILKYLALVYPTPGREVEAPPEAATYQIVFTPRPAWFRENGWGAARFFSPQELPVPPETV